jgi:hypothetical protein
MHILTFGAYEAIASQAVPHSRSQQYVTPFRMHMYLSCIADADWFNYPTVELPRWIALIDIDLLERCCFSYFENSQVEGVRAEKIMKLSA